MVAQVSSETFTSSAYTPRPDPSDSDDVLLALETARALEAQGDVREAARWLRRAADQAEKDDNDARVLVFARAAADLKNTIGPSPSSMPPSQPGRVSSIQAPRPKPATVSHPTSASAHVVAPTRISESKTPTAPAIRVSAPPPLPARAASQRAAAPTSPSRPPAAPRTASPSHLRTPPASPAAIASRPTPVGVSSPARPISAPAEKAGAQHSIRVAVPASLRHTNLFVVRRLETGQSPPAGTVEAVLVLRSGKE